MKKLILGLSILATVPTFAMGVGSFTKNAGVLPVAADKPLSPSTIDYLTVSSVEVVDVTSQYEDQRKITIESLLAKKKIVSQASAKMSLQGAQVIAVLETADIVVDKVINIGSKIWTVAEKGKPVQNYRNTAATALPQNLTDWNTSLENWKDPQTKVIKVIYKNIFGYQVVDFTYRITLLAGGSYHGVGNYIGYAAVEPVNMNTSYLYTFDAVASVDSVYNKGTSANPLAGMVLNVRWNISTIVSKAQGSHQFNLDGTGAIKQVQ